MVDDPTPDDARARARRACEAHAAAAASLKQSAQGVLTEAEQLARMARNRSNPAMAAVRSPPAGAAEPAPAADADDVTGVFGALRADAALAAKGP